MLPPSVTESISLEGGTGANRTRDAARPACVGSVESVVIIRSLSQVVRSGVRATDGWMAVWLCPTASVPYREGKLQVRCPLLYNISSILRRKSRIKSIYCVFIYLLSIYSLFYDAF
jgi:hypothetical protein